MPCKTYVCEFCSIEFRKDELGRHVKAKHLKELGLLLLQDLQECGNVTPILQYAKSLLPQNIPIPSRMYNGAVYFFGVKATFFPEDESYSQYIKSEQNMEEHNNFLKEIFSSISLLDFIELKRDIEVRSENTLLLQKINRKLKSDLDELRNEYDNYKANTDKTLFEYKYTIDEINNGKTANEFNSEISHLTYKANQFKFQLERTTKQLELINQRRDEEIEELNMKRLNEVEILQQNYDNVSTKLKKTEATLAKKEIRIKAEAEKLKKKEKDDKKKKLKEIKKAMKEMSDSESDVDSD